MKWLSVRTHNTGVASSSPARVTIKHVIGEEGNGKPPHKTHYHRKQLRTLSLVSATLEIEYAKQFYSKQFYSKQFYSKQFYSKLVFYMSLKMTDRFNAHKSFASPPQRLVTVCVRIEFEAINKTNPPYQYVRLAADSTAYDALSAAQELHPCYKNVVKTSSHGLFLTSLCNEGTSEAKGLYWMFYLDDKLSSLGLNEQRVKENQCIVLKYKELAVKK